MHFELCRKKPLPTITMTHSTAMLMAGFTSALGICYLDLRLRLRLRLVGSTVLVYAVANDLVYDRCAGTICHGYLQFLSI
jgi:hypothetical protein